MATTRFTLRSAVYLLLIKDNQILLLRRFNTGWQDGNYSVPAGHLDGGETVKQAMVREAKEEAGIDINSEDLQVVHVMHRRSVNETVGSMEYIDFFLTAKRWKGTPNLTEPDRADDLAFFPLTALPKNILSYVRLAIEAYQQSIPYSEFGWSGESY